MLEILRNPWPWYVAGPLIGLTVPLLLLLGNRSFGISSSLRHVCAMCVPAKIPFFQYDWKKESWNLAYVLGIVLGGIITSLFLADPNPVVVDARLLSELSAFGVTDFSQMVPKDLFGVVALGSTRTWLITILGGFLVGFGARYAGGCTSGHAITGLATLQWPSLVATCCFMIGGFVMANFFLPFFLSI
jgi:uncharacterized protein